MTPEFLTIGVYGASETDFFQALVAAEVDTFCDIRRRRGMRGARYAFANSTYLQKKLQTLGIRYVHRKDLAPPPEIRQKQGEADRESKTKKRERQSLSQTFIEAYRAACLADFAAEVFAQSFGPEARRVVLFCVEREPEACHRSLVAEKLAAELPLEVKHLRP
jgi:uncharacterized protein (DUF488 family)